jgi:hypothetical protein
MLMKQITIILIHTGFGPLPSHLHETLEITSRVAKKSRIIFLSNRINRKAYDEIIGRFEGTPKQLPTIEFIAIEDVPESLNSRKFRDSSTLNRSFRDGFWFNASDRFLVLADFMSSYGVKNVIHIENDYVLYFDPSEKFDAFHCYADFAVPLDRIRAIPGIVWLKDAVVANRLAQSIVDNPNQDDMASVGKFCIDHFKNGAKPLPTIPLRYANLRGLNYEQYSSGIDTFGGIFDAASLGQYLGGVHWMNDPNDTTFFMNESSDLKVSDFSFSWAIHDNLKSPQLTFEGDETSILGLHVHSKNLSGVSPFNHGVQYAIEDLVTGERIQALCDVTVSTPSVTKFHGRMNILSRELIEFPEDAQGNLLQPTTELIERLVGVKTIFVYTHLIPYFRYFIAPRLNSPFTLVTHNSDHPVTMMDFELLNHPYLKNWFAQNCEFSHSKLKALPIGLENSQWGADKLGKMMDAGRKILKTDLLYANFSIQTHPSRVDAMSVAKKLGYATIETGVNYEEYLKSLVHHKFCICPRGNGIDTHRFWEAQYLDCIPIILSCDWTASYSDMPVLILDSWALLEELDLNAIYIKISNKYYSRGALSLSKIAEDMKND